MRNKREPSPATQRYGHVLVLEKVISNQLSVISKNRKEKVRQDNRIDRIF